MAKKTKPKKGTKISKPKKVAGKVKKSAKKNTVKKVVKKNKVKPNVKKSNVSQKNKKASAKKIKVSSKKQKPVVKKVAAKKKEIKKVIAKKSVAKVVIKAKEIKNKKEEKIKVVATPKEKIVKKKVEELLPKKAVEKPLVAPKSGKRGRKKKKSGDDDDVDMDEPIDAELLQLIDSETKKAASKKKGPKMIKTFINPINALPTSFDLEDSKSGKNKKEPKGKFELEYVVRTSPGILFECLSTPSGLSEWFADDVNIRDGVFTFFWDGSEQKAKLLGYKEEKFIRFRWLDKADNSYFEFRIEKDELTGDISLIITDFAEEAADKETSRLLWDSQVNKLLHVLGAV